MTHKPFLFWLPSLREGFGEANFVRDAGWWRPLVGFLLLLFTLPSWCAPTFPTLSTDGDEHWYYIQMQRGLCVLTAMGEGRNLQTAEPVESKRDAQLWKVEADGQRYRLTTRGGQVMNYNGDKFRTMATPSAGYSAFRIVSTTNASFEGYEIYVDQLGTANAYLNQWGGFGSGRELGCWSKGDPNNPLQFVAEADMSFPDVPPSAVSEVSVRPSTNWRPANKHTLWYATPGTTWMSQSLPIGNGQFGATILGGVHRDEVQFNDKTLWRGHVGSVVDNGSYGSYLDFGHLYITTTDASAATNYRRYLDIDEARAGVAFTMAGIDFEREYVASHPDDVVAIRYSASEAGKLNTQLLLYNPNGAKPAYSVAGGQGIATFSGNVPRTGTSQPESYYCMAMVVAEGGTIEATPEGISVSGADAMTVYLRGMTNFSPDNDDYISPSNLLPERVGTTVREAAQKGYDALLADHVADYQRLYQRCQLTLTEAANNTNTPRLISLFRSNPANNLLLPELYFAYGRYLLISSSRGVALPANLQGIWNNSNSPAWNSDIHSNINVQMNYWPAEVTNLSDLHTAFTDYIHREACLRKQWTANARQIAGQTVGWTLTTENNIYGSGSNWMQNYTIANAWYCMHLWQHYRYTLDTDYLWQVALPAMHSCCQYWMQRLVLASDGTYECPREYSPEHGPASENATAHSQQLVYDLFKSTLEGYAEYGRRTGKDYMNLELVEFLTELQDKFDRLDPGTATEVVNGRTLLREWKYTSQANVSSYNSHRHLSHLIGLYPGSQIGEDIDAGIYEAAKNSLNIRGYGGTGWSLAWKVNLHARCHDGARCQRLLLNALALTNVTYNDGSERGGIYENLWDAHPPFQIDGNFGVTAGMAEMLVQSHLGAIEILPALPADTWRKGSVNGLRAVGAFGVDIEWANATATKVVITSDAGETAVVKYADIANQYAVSDDNGQPVATTILADNLISFPTEAGHSYTIAPKTDDAIALPGERPHADVIATRHYGPNGTAISASTPGLQIRQQHLSDGTTRTQKTVKK